MWLSFLDGGSSRRSERAIAFCEALKRIRSGCGPSQCAARQPLNDSNVFHLELQASRLHVSGADQFLAGDSRERIRTKG